jgi:tetratricopeptide (TPR) repeat protein
VGYNSLNISRGRAMKIQLALLALLALTLSLLASAQSRTGGRKSPGITRTPQLGTPVRGSIFLSGRVVLEDGSELTEQVSIQTICRGQKRTETHSDSHGNFSFELGNQNPMSVAAGMMDADTSFSEGMSTTRGNQRDWRDCELQAVLPGFSSQSIQLSSRVSSFESSDIGRLTLHRLAHVDGLTISVTSALAPNPARKAFDKGREQERKNQWDKAQESFEKAVQLYPQYAVAWFELGRVQGRVNNATGARESFGKALAADPKYISPYQALAQLGASEKRWTDVVEITDKLLRLNPVDFPEAWLLNSVGNYLEQNFEAAEKSAQQGIKVDETHRAPKLEYLLGMLLLRKQDYSGASQHMQQYLSLAMQPAEVEEAHKQLAEIARLSSLGGLASASPKK